MPPHGGVFRWNHSWLGAPACRAHQRGAEPVRGAQPIGGRRYVMEIADLVSDLRREVLLIPLRRRRNSAAPQPCSETLRGISGSVGLSVDTFNDLARPSKADRLHGLHAGAPMLARPS